MTDSPRDEVTLTKGSVGVSGSASDEARVFEAALLLIKAGGDYSISGPNLVVANVPFEMDKDQRQAAWAAVKEGSFNDE